MFIINTHNILDTPFFSFGERNLHTKQIQSRNTLNQKNTHFLKMKRQMFYFTYTYKQQQEYFGRLTWKRLRYTPYVQLSDLRSVFYCNSHFILQTQFAFLDGHSLLLVANEAPRSMTAYVHHSTIHTTYNGCPIQFNGREQVKYIPFTHKATPSIEVTGTANIHRRFCLQE